MGENVVMLSAGLDSAVNFLLALEEGGVAAAVTVDYGQRAAMREVERAGRLCAARGVRHLVLEARWLGELSRDALTTAGEPLPEVDVSALGNEAAMRETARAVWVPNRNGLLAAMGACVAEALGARWVVMGLNAEEAATFPDNSRAFVEETNRALRYSTRAGIGLRSFTVDWDKMDILREALARELDFGLIWACYNGGTAMCGHCESCARLLGAAAGLGVRERLAGFFTAG